MILLLSLFASVALADDFVIEKIIGNASEIQLVRNDGWKQVPAVGAKMPQGTRVLTGSKGGVVVRLPDGSSVLLLADSEVAFHVTGPKQTDIELNQGRSRATVPKSKTPVTTPRFRFRTKAATMGVRGTDFTVEVKGEETAVHVLDGTVEVVRTGLAKPDYVLEPKQALSLGGAPSGKEQPQAFEPAEFLKTFETGLLPEELHWWQRLWLWILSFFT